MIYLPNRSPLIRPAGEAQINWAHPLAQGLVFFPTFSPGLATLLSAGSFSVTQLGSGIRATNSTNGGCWFPWSASLASITTALTVVCWAKPETMASFSVLVSVPYRSGSWNSPYAAMMFTRYMTSSQGNLHIGYGSSSFRQFASPTNFILASSNVHQYVVARNSGNCRFYSDGKYFGTSGSTYTESVDWTNAQPLCVLNQSNSYPGSSFTEATCGYVGIWNRALTPMEVEWLYVEPFAFLGQRRTQALIIPPAFNASWARNSNQVIGAW
jgi:hypothetical protein